MLVDRAIVIPDQHFPLHDQQAIDVVLKAIEIIKPSIFINLGDVGEFNSVSAWKYKKIKQPPLEYQLPEIDEDIKQVNEGIDQFDRVLDKIKCEKKYVCTGNHDIWLDNFVLKHPYMKEYTFKKACKWEERGYNYVPYNKPLRIGKVRFIHGVFATMYHAKKHLEAFGVNLVYGHTHDIQRHSLSKLGDGTIGAFSLGCLKDMSPEKNQWLRGSLTNWNHAFGIIDFYKGGNFKVEVVEIVKGRTSVWGEMIVA